jgi:hypothetical protein
MSGLTPNSSWATITPVPRDAVAAGRARYAGNVVPSATGIEITVMTTILLVSRHW